jgi:hypothetical protein
LYLTQREGEREGEREGKKREKGERSFYLRREGERRERNQC